MNESLPIREMIIQGWPVFSVLVALSIISLAIMLERWMVFSRSGLDPKAFLETLKKSAPDRDFSKAAAACRKMRQPLAAIAAAILSEPGRRDQKERVLERTIRTQVGAVENHVAALGTIASIAPFVGLLGTVIGIIKAFHAISVSVGGGPGVVAGGIAEALINTAVGLIVAIPAVVAFNYFSNRIRLFTQEWEVAGGEIIDWAEGERG